MRKYTSDLLEDLLSKTDLSDMSFYVSEWKDIDGVSIYDERYEIVLYLSDKLGAPFFYNESQKTIQRQVDLSEKTK